MSGIPQQEMLEAGVHFGHLKKKWNPKMLPYIFMEHKGIHIIDLNKTNASLRRAADGMRKLVSGGKDILFVATKKQAKDIVADMAREVNMPYVTERWLGGMLTNFTTIRKSIKKRETFEKLLTENASALTKKERLMLSREKDKLDRVLGGIANLRRLPAALFIVDITHEHIALAEARKLNLRTFALVDTNSDPTLVDFPIPANDDASKSVSLITRYLVDAIKEGLAERKKNNTENDMRAEKESGERRNRNNRKRRRRNNKGGGGNNQNAAAESANAPAAKPADDNKTEA